MCSKGRKFQQLIAEEGWRVLSERGIVWIFHRVPIRLKGQAARQLKQHGPIGQLNFKKNEKTTRASHKTWGHSATFPNSSSYSSFLRSLASASSRSQLSRSFLPRSPRRSNWSELASGQQPSQSQMHISFPSP